MKIDYFAPIDLSEMNAVKLMNRTDTKYWFHVSQLHNLLKAVRNSYFILTIKSEVVLLYSTIYFDSVNNQMFTAHHNGKLNRYKVRRRSYVSSGISFLEVKFKSNKGRTIKTRIPSEFGNTLFTDKENEFLREIIPFNPSELLPSLINSFKRITLVNKNFDERCTIDLTLQFESRSRLVSLDNLVIVEIKTDGLPSASPLAKTLRNQRIKTSGFSKYCIGRAVTDSDLKRNSFKAKIRNIEKTIQTENNLYDFN